jgi:type IV pilus assembly protein PilA
MIRRLIALACLVGLAGCHSAPTATAAAPSDPPGSAASSDDPRIWLDNARNLRVDTIAAQVQEGETAAGVPEMKVSNFYDQHGTFPTSQKEAGLDDPSTYKGAYVSSVDATSTPGQLLITYDGPHANSEIAGKTMILNIVVHKPGATGISANNYYDCNGGTVSKQYHPTHCLH